MRGRGFGGRGMGMGPGMGPGMRPGHGWGMRPPMMGPFWHLWPGMMWPGMMLLMGAVTILLYGNRPVKLRQTDVKVIETDTGKSVEELSEKELIDALKRLEIEKMELNDEDRAQIKAAQNDE